MPFSIPLTGKQSKPCRQNSFKYAKSASRLAAWLEDNILQGLTVFALPACQQRHLRTTNGLERLNRKIRRRTHVAALFPNKASCLRLVTALVLLHYQVATWITTDKQARFAESAKSVAEATVVDFSDSLNE